jgi:uncharacterized protein (DUF1499 family)
MNGIMDRKTGEEGSHPMLSRVFIGIIRSFEQSGEKSKYPALQTRYYKLSKDRSWEELAQLLTQLPSYQLVHTSQERGEIVLKKRGLLGRLDDITVTVYPLSPIKMAIDVYSSSRGSFGDLGSNYRNIVEIYSAIDRTFASHKI